VTGADLALFSEEVKENSQASKHARHREEAMSMRCTAFVELTSRVRSNDLVTPLSMGTRHLLQLASRRRRRALFSPYTIEPSRNVLPVTGSPAPVSLIWRMRLPTATRWRHLHGAIDHSIDHIGLAADRTWGRACVDASPRGVLRIARPDRDREKGTLHLFTSVLYYSVASTIPQGFLSD
jgi:hypothetical protein